MPIIRPAEPVITPADRSNSPPIISSATTTAGMPIVEATSVQLAMPSSFRNSEFWVQKKIADDDGGQQRPDLGAAQEAGHRADLRQPLVRDAGRAAGRSRLVLDPSSPRVRGGRAAGRAVRAGRSPRRAASGCPGRRASRRSRRWTCRRSRGRSAPAGRRRRCSRWSCRASGTRSAGSPAGTAAGRRRTGSSPSWMSLMHVAG